jgi:Fe2+ transport system protein FeoA
MLFRRKAGKIKRDGLRPPALKKSVIPLGLLEPGQRGVIASIQLRDPANLSRLASLGLTPGTPVLVERTAPVLSVRLPYSHLFMDDELAEKILVHIAPAKR